MKRLDKILQKYDYNSANIIQILQDIQSHYRYLPRDILMTISQKLRMPLNKIYSIATFYSAFSLSPRGKHSCTVCVGTACHVRGAPTILNEFERELGIKAGETTSDREYTLATVNCLGCCAIGPIVVYDGTYIGEFKLKDVARVLEKKP